MCLVSSPKAPAAAPTPQYLHNPYLDSGTMAGAIGRNQLVVGLNSPASSGVGTGSPAPNSGRQQLPGLTMPIGTPGMVVPTIGGSMAGSLPGAPVAGTPGAK